MAPSSPFDFSDFGARPPSAQPGPGPGPGFPGAPPAAPGFGPPPRPPGPSGGFDPFAGQPVAVPAASNEAFGGPVSATAGALSVAGPPLALFAAALGVAVLGIILGAVGGSAVLLAFTGWLAAGPAAIGVLAWFNGVDTRRRLSSVYSAPTWLSSAYWVVMAACAVGIGLAAWHIAWWAGTR